MITAPTMLSYQGCDEMGGQNTDRREKRENGKNNDTCVAYLK